MAPRHQFQSSCGHGCEARSIPTDRRYCRINTFSRSSAADIGTYTDKASLSSTSTAVSVAVSFATSSAALAAAAAAAATASVA